MVWLYRSPIPVGRRGVFYLFKFFLPAFAALRGGGSAPCGRDPEKLNQLANPLVLERHDFDP
jgi:hypothetical protein